MSAQHPPREGKVEGSKRRNSTIKRKAAAVKTDQARLPDTVRSPPSGQSTSSGASPTTPNSQGSTSFGKIAIPRLSKGEGILAGQSSREITDRNRVTHACEQCRQRKTKCSGERPICKHCQDFKLDCSYADGKRDRARKEVDHMAQTLSLYESLLMEAAPHLGPSIWSRFQEARSSADFAIDDDDDEEGSQRSRRRSQGSVTKRVNMRSASSGSMDSVDMIGEDVSRTTTTRATGYMGKTSEIEWQSGLNKKEADKALRFDANWNVNPVETFSMSDMNYNLDDEELYDIRNSSILTYARPPAGTARSLLDAYFKMVQPNFPILGKLNFMTQVQQYYDKFEDQEMAEAPSRTPNGSWLTVLNLIFALGARYMSLAQLPYDDAGFDSGVYFVRARRLGLNQQSLFDQPDLQRTQIATLASLYLLSVNQLNRSWLFCSLAIRYAVALALHLQIQNDTLPEPLKELRYRLWWAIYTLDRTLEVMTGRPAPITSTAFSTPMPLPYDEEDLFDETGALKTGKSTLTAERLSHVHYRVSAAALPPEMHMAAANLDNLARGDHFSNAQGSPLAGKALFFIAHSRLALIVHEIVQSIYNPISAHNLWSQLQTCIADCNKQLDVWVEALPSALDFRKEHIDTAFHPQRVILGCFFYNCRMIANRPCLCDMDPGNDSETPAFMLFNKDAAHSCVMAAIGKLQLFSNEYNSASLYRVSPWWCLVHHLTQATTVLTIELFYQCMHMPDQSSSQQVLHFAMVGIMWLRRLGEEAGDKAAGRASEMTQATLVKVGQRLGFDTRINFGSLNFNYPSGRPASGPMSPLSVTGPVSGRGLSSPLGRRQAVPGMPGRGRNNPYAISYDFRDNIMMPAIGTAAEETDWTQFGEGGFLGANMANDMADPGYGTYGPPSEMYDFNSPEGMAAAEGGTAWQGNSGLGGRAGTGAGTGSRAIQPSAAQGGQGAGAQSGQGRQQGGQQAGRQTQSSSVKGGVRGGAGASSPRRQGSGSALAAAEVDGPGPARQRQPRPGTSGSSRMQGLESRAMEDAVADEIDEAR